ncbi:hypothetical protein M758_11G080700 [Ceratodon purpureus]|uniref:Myb-like domain-containing protein n=1 Tax=Ceratodon purpureus TaxID=3225 RepID=A0A8T0GEC0_CERPU|nr:hypothetical protein KC19_11G083900 [Ceratodon purpureus]KAG0601054.1 hypothetical protein M758_11G080700 [Ceratodon purpureus]
MSDPHQATSSVNYFFDALLSDDGQQYDSSTLEYISSCAGLPEKGARWAEWSDFEGLGMDVTENAVTSQSDSDVDVAKAEGWIGDDMQPQQSRKKRKLTGCREVVEVPAGKLAGVGVQASRERQRGKNWEKAEEDILVESKRKEMDWKSISEVLKERGFIRNHKHCADKWYALRKHYLEIHQWMADNPDIQYWDRSDGERIRSVPPSFCQKWYQIFDAAEKREGRKKVSLNQRRKSDSAAAVGAHPSHSLAMANFTPRSDSAFRAQPSCSLSDGMQHHLGDHHHQMICSGDATHKIEHCPDDAGFFSTGAMGAYSDPPKFNIQMLVREIHNLSYALSLKFDAEEKERARNFAIKEKKLELKRLRFDYKRQRDEEKRKTVAQCLNVAVKAYD